MTHVTRTLQPLDHSKCWRAAHSYALHMLGGPPSFQPLALATAVKTVAVRPYMAVQKPWCTPVRRLLGPSWLAWQLASGAVLAEASWPLFLVLQLRQGDLTDK